MIVARSLGSGNKVRVHTLFGARGPLVSKTKCVYQCRSLESVGAEFRSQVGPDSHKLEFEFELVFSRLTPLPRHGGGNDAQLRCPAARVALTLLSLTASFGLVWIGLTIAQLPCSERALAAAWASVPWNTAPSAARALSPQLRAARAAWSSTCLFEAHTAYASSILSRR